MTNTTFRKLTLITICKLFSVSYIFTQTPLCWWWVWKNFVYLLFYNTTTNVVCVTTITVKAQDGPLTSVYSHHYHPQPLSQLLNYSTVLHLSRMLYKWSHTYVIFWNWIFLLTVIPLKSIQVVCINSWFLFIAKSYSMIWMYHNCDIDPSKNIWVIYTLGLWTNSWVQSLSRVWLSVTPWATARQAFLSITNSRSLPKLMSTESVMPSNHLILCHPLLLPPSVFPSHQGLFEWVSSSHQVARSIGVSASASVLPMNIQDWSPLGWTGWISFQSKGLSRVFSNTIVQKHQFFAAQLSL